MSSNAPGTITAGTEAGEDGAWSSRWLNGYLATSLVYGFEKLGLWDRLERGELLRHDDLGRALDADPGRVAAMLQAACRLGMLRVSASGDVTVAPEGSCLLGDRNKYTIALGGYGQFFSNLAELATGAMRWGTDVQRDDAAISKGCAQMQASTMRIVDEILDGVRFDRVADIGCADASRLIHLCQRYPHVTGVGIDLSPMACELAGRKVEEAGLADRIEMVCCDVMAVIADPDRHLETLGDVDLVSNYLMLHHLISNPDQRAGVVLGLKRAFPGAAHFLIADHVLTAPEGAAPVPVFSLEFELLHAFMDVHTLPRADYEELFARTGLEIARVEPFGHPDEWIYLLRNRG